MTSVALEGPRPSGGAGGQGLRDLLGDVEAAAAVAHDRRDGPDRAPGDPPPSTGERDQRKDDPLPEGALVGTDVINPRDALEAQNQDRDAVAVDDEPAPMLDLEAQRIGGH